MEADENNRTVDPTVRMHEMLQHRQATAFELQHCQQQLEAARAHVAKLESQRSEVAARLDEVQKNVADAARELQRALGATAGGNPDAVDLVALASTWASEAQGLYSEGFTNDRLRTLQQELLQLQAAQAKIARSGRMGDQVLQQQQQQKQQAEQHQLFADPGARHRAWVEQQHGLAPGTLDEPAAA